MQKNSLSTDYLKNVKLTRKASMPLYKQLYEGLLNIITSGLLEDQSHFYSEYKLMNYFNVSRITVRQALQLLENDGFIKRSQGNKTVVTHPPRYSWDFHDLTDDLYTFGEDLETILIDAQLIDSNDSINQCLNLPKNNLSVYRIERLRIVKEIRFAYSISYLIPSLDLDLDQVRQTKNLSIRELLRAHGEEAFYSSEIIEAVNANLITSQYLNLPEHFAVFLRKRITYDRNDKPLEYVESYYNSKVTSYYTNKRMLKD